MQVTDKSSTGRLVSLLIWICFASVIAVPIAIATLSPYLAGRDAIYITAGLAGIVALALLLAQPLLAAGYLPGLRGLRGRRWHRLIGAAIIGAVALHVGGLYLTSPPDAIDALLLVSPTPFSVYGVVGLWCVVLTAVLVAAKSRIKLRYTLWRNIHNGVAVILVVCSVVHALLIQGTMGSLSKLVLCACVLAVTAFVIVYLRIIQPMLKKR
ncbi:MAG: ferric reductase-like transmembrane domain-containing protein [Stappiaceae bacterium]